MNSSIQNSKKVLVIEDEKFISDLYVRALIAAGYKATVIFDGKEALEAAKANSFDIILLDIMLPNLPGSEVLRRLRDPKEVPHLKAKIIITTNLDLDEQARLETESQADGYIIKAEVTPKELVAFLNQLQLNS